MCTADSDAAYPNLDWLFVCKFGFVKINALICVVFSEKKEKKRRKKMIRVRVRSAF